MNNNNKEFNREQPNKNQPQPQRQQGNEQQKQAQQPRNPNEATDPNVTGNPVANKSNNQADKQQNNPNRK